MRPRGKINFPVFILLFCFFWCFKPLLVAKVALEVRNNSYFTVRDFKRIPEFFTGKEFQGWKVYCRSNPKERDGFYFVVKVSGISSEMSPNAYWKLDWISSINPASQTVKIPVNNPDIVGKEVFIGLTGNDWPGKLVKPLAWRICLMDSEDHVIAKRQSFLWSQ